MMLDLNNNMLLSIVSYLPMKTCSSIAQVNKALNGFVNTNINCKWREDCNQYFYSPKNESSSIDCVAYAKALDIRSYSTEIDWKSHFEKMICNRKAFLSYENESFSSFKEQFRTFESELFNAIRNESFLPKLRKPNYVFESMFNSPHQLFFFDLKKEEQFLYFYYDNHFFQNRQQKQRIQLKNTNLPLEHFIYDFNQIMSDINSSLNDKAIIEEAINYNFTKANEIINCNSNSNVNPLIYFIVHFYNYIRDYCFFTMNYLMKYAKYSHSRNGIENQSEITSELFLNEYNQRYDSFISGTLILNEQLENFNVCMNYLNEFLFNTSCSNRKFNVYKMLYTIWNNEVLLPLASNGVFDLHLPIFLNAYFKSELTPQRINEVKATHNNTIDLVLSCCLQINEVSDNNIHSLTKKSLIELIANSFLDVNCNEDTVCSINHSATHFQFYNSFEIMFCSIAYDVLSDKIRNLELTKENIFDYLKNEASYGFDLIPKTKKGFIKAVVLSLKDSLRQQLVSAHLLHLASKKNNKTTNLNEPLMHLFINERNNTREFLISEFHDIQRLLVNIGMSTSRFKEETAIAFANDFINSHDNIIFFMKELYHAYYELLQRFESNDDEIIAAIENNKTIWENKRAIDIQREKKDQLRLNISKQININEICL